MVPVPGAIAGVLGSGHTSERSSRVMRSIASRARWLESTRWVVSCVRFMTKSSSANAPSATISAIHIAVRSSGSVRPSSRLMSSTSRGWSSLRP